MKKKHHWLGMGVAVSTLGASIALAHHSNAMFDDTKEVEVAGTVQQYQWTNPHVFIELMVDGAEGPHKFTIESPTPGVLRGHGWKFNTLQPGDKVAFLGIGSGLNCLMLGLEW